MKKEVGWFALVLFAVVLCLLVYADASTYYVCSSQATCGEDWGPGSNSNSGLTKMTPWKSLDAAEERVKGGDTVIVGSGIYSSPSQEWSDVVLWIEANGQGNLITIRSEHKHGAIIDGKGSMYGGVWIDGSAADIHLDGFVIRNVKIAGINSKDSDDKSPYKRSSNIKLTNLLVHDFGRSGITLQEMDDAIVEGCVIHTQTAAHPSHNQYHGLYISDNTDNIVVRNNIIHGIIEGWPIHVYDGHGRGSATGHWIGDNILVSHSPHRDGGIVLYGSGHQVHNNIIYNEVNAPGYNAAIYNNKLTASTHISGNQTNLTVLCERFSSSASCSGATVSDNSLGANVAALLNADYTLKGTPEPEPEPDPEPEPEPEPEPIDPMFTDCELVMVCRQPTP